MAGETVGDGIPGAFGEALERLCATVADAAAREQSWLERVEAGLSAALSFLDREPRWASLLSAEEPLEGAVLAEGTRRVHEALREVLDAARGSVVVAFDPQPSTWLIAELLALALLSVLRAQILAADGRPRRPLAASAPSLMSHVVAPYLGRALAGADLHRRWVPARPEVVPVRPHPSIMLVLGALAARPEQSARELEGTVNAKDTAGKQIAPLIRRLRERGLIEAVRRAGNQPNRWLLTPYGRRVLELNTRAAGARPPRRAPQTTDRPRTRGASVAAPRQFPTGEGDPSLQATELAAAPSAALPLSGDAALFADPLERLCRTVAHAAAGEQLWLERIGAGLMAALAFLEQERGWARTLLLEQEQLAVALAASRLHAALGEVLDQARGQVIVGSRVAPSPERLAELLACALVCVVRARMLTGDGPSLVGLAPSLMEQVIEPYLAAGAALADRARERSPAARVPREATVLPLRAHPRVIQTLRLIADEPAHSSRELSERLDAGRDRHDLSGLLNLLEQRGLLEGARPAGVTRDRTAWRLTSYGQRALELLDAATAARPRERPRCAGSRHLSARPARRSARASRSAA